MTIKIPDELARNLEPIAGACHKSVQQFAIERLETLVRVPKTPADLLCAIRRLEHPSTAAVNDLDAAIRTAESPIRNLQQPRFRPA